MLIHLNSNSCNISIDRHDSNSILWKKKGKGQEPYFQLFFTIGFFWLTVSVVLILALNL